MSDPIFDDYLKADWWRHPNYNECLPAEKIAELLDSDASLEEGVIFLECMLAGDGVDILVERAGRLAEISLLGIVNCGLGPQGAEKLADLALTDTHTLDLSRNMFGLDWSRRLSDAPLLQGLERLGFAGNVLEPGEFTISGSITDALCRGKACRTLKSLNLQDSYLTGSDTWFLFDAHHLPELVDLDISNNVDLGNGGLQPWSQTAMRLKRLVAADCSLGDDQVRILAEGEASEELLWLDLSFNPLGTEAVEALYESPHLEKLERLDLKHVSLTDDADQLLEQWRQKGVEINT